MATMDSQYTMTKYSNNPVIDIIPDGYTKHVRDPKVGNIMICTICYSGPNVKIKQELYYYTNHKTYTIGISKARLQQT